MTTKSKEEFQQGEKVEKKEFEMPYACKLAHPITWGRDQVISEIVFSRRLKVADFKGIPTGDLKFDHMVRVVSRVTGTAEAILMELDITDFMQLSEVVNSFLENGQESGEI